MQASGGMVDPTPEQRYLTFHSTAFPTEGGWIGDDPDPERPAGREVIECLSLAVDPAMPLTDIWNQEGYGWAFNCKVGRITVNVLVQYDDQWLVIVNEVSLRPRFLRGPEYEAAVLEVSRRIQGALSALSHVTDARWTTAAEYGSHWREA